LGLVQQEVLDAIINGAEERRRETSPPRLSSEEQAFFQSFEEQMKGRFGVT